MSTAEVECKKVCVFRCLYALCLSVGMQYLLLAVFLLFVNFNILHPLDWLSGTLSIIFSFYTWLCIIPLIIMIIIYGIFLGNSYLSVRKYYPTRFSYIWSTAVRKFISFFIHGAIGFLTAWLYARFLNEDYRLMFFECFDGYCLNSRYAFLTLSGTYTGLYYFVKERLNKDPEIEFPIIQESKYVKIRSQLYATLYSSLLKSFVPMIYFSLLYWIMGWMVAGKIAEIFGAEQLDQNFISFFSIITNLRLIFYVWILSSQILTNMYLMNVFFSILLTQQMEFSIEKASILMDGKDVTIIEALSLSKVPIAQQLASLDLFNLAFSKNPARRQQIYSLSVPGGHPYNWNQLSGQCLSMINDFTEELASSMKNIASVKTNSYYTIIKPTASEAAEKILLRQYNETYGIRNMMSSQPYAPPPSPPVQNDPCKRVNDAFDQFGKTIQDAFKTAFHTIPGLFYLFGEQDGAKTAFILSNSKDIVWISQGIAGICASSLKEDKYGVVQCELPNVIRSLIKLKSELDKLNNVYLNGKKLDRNLIELKNAVKRSLYKICTVFAEYIKDLIDDPDELKVLHCYVNYLEN